MPGLDFIELEGMLKRRVEALCRDEYEEPTWRKELRQEAFQRISGRLMKLRPVKQTLVDFLIAKQGSSSARQAQKDAAAAFRSMMAPLRARGLVVCTLEEAWVTHGNLLKRYWPSPPRNLYCDLWLAVGTGGFLLLVPAGLQIDIPLQPPPLEGFPLFQSQFVILEKGAQLEFMDGCYNEVSHTQSFKLDMLQVGVKEGAKLKMVSLQNLGGEVFDDSLRYLYLGKGANLAWHDVRLGYNQGRLWHEAELGRGGQFLYEGLFTCDPPPASVIGGNVVLDQESHWQGRLLALSGGEQYAAQNTAEKVGSFVAGFSPRQNPRTSLKSFLDNLPMEYGVELAQRLGVTL